MKTVVDLLFLQVMPMIRNIREDVDTHLYQTFYNSTRECYILAVVGAYSLIYCRATNEVIIAFRLEDDGTWGSGTYFQIENEDLFPPLSVKEACKQFLINTGLIE